MKNFYGQTFQCECGKTHYIEPREVVYSEDAISQLPSVLERSTTGRRIAILSDIRTREAAGEDVVNEISRHGWQVTNVLIPDPSPDQSPHCDDITKEAVLRKIPEVDIFLPVGSGIMSDLGKWLAWERKVPFVTFATAASMNGYASGNSAPTVDGVKILVMCKPPVAVVSSPKILANAPYELTSAGLGDILAKSVSSTDWLLNHLLFGDYYCARSVNLIASIEPLYMDNPKEILNRSPKAMKALFQGLLLTGIAMTMAETSAPASGAEHLISHTLDLMSSLNGSPYDLHGRQVGLGTIISSELYRRVMELESPTLREPRTAIDSEFWGKYRDTINQLYSEKIERLSIAHEKITEGNNWDNLRDQLKPLLRLPEQIQSCLKSAEAAWKAEQINCSRERLLELFLHAHEIRARFTVLDLAYLVGILPDAAEEIIEQWA